jgi:hypothetical protein
MKDTQAREKHAAQEAPAAEWKPQGDFEAELSAITEIHTRSIREAF